MPQKVRSDQALADLPCVSFSAMRHVILRHAKISGSTVLEDNSEHLTVETAHGLIGLRPRKSAEAAGMVASRDAR